MQVKTFENNGMESELVHDAYSMLTSNIYLSSGESKFKYVLITSCLPGEGKTTVATNLAKVTSEWGWKTLLVDVNFRKGVYSRMNDILYGISDILQGFVEIDEALCETNIENLTYLPAGRYTSIPMGILCSQKFDEILAKIGSQYDFIIFDSPALSSVTDAEIIASKADATILVANLGVDNMMSISKAKQLVEKVNGHFLGVVVNKMNRRKYGKYFKIDRHTAKAGKETKVIESGAKAQVAAD